MDFIEQLTHIGLSNSVELLVFGLMMMALQFFIPARKGQKEWDKSSAIDIGYSFLLALCTPIFYLLPVALVETLLQRFPEVTVWREAFSQGWPAWLQVFIAVVVVDFVSYWRHRLMHYKGLWPIHAIHHSSHRLNWLSTERFHLLNFFISSFINIIVVQLLFFPPVVIFASMLRRLYNFFIHANVKVDFGPLAYVFVSPRFHHWHHSIDEDAADKNYSTFFSLFDWLFGTFYLPKDKSYPTNYGERSGVEENIWAHFLHPFKVWAKKAS